MGQGSRPQQWRHADINPERLVRAIHCTVVPQGGGVFAVTSVSSPDIGTQHWVHLEDPEVPVCDCEDHAATDRLCKHAIAALLHEGDPRLLVRVGQVVRRGWLARRLVLAITPLPMRRRDRS